VASYSAPSENKLEE